ncbi:PepSY domain-containing protein [Pigmentiphaga aceris]|uniref:PepSY domain-containing protein n=1 Tax=Pigmentiphaga aceris TaxID=1940612 RepID=A0A5C0B1C0_9BURK|nr:PepSY-associated TM helix domain-containing protein [Pigmentiphaga aceris]QEI07563.1 PepSY domain-containing protein [Pigmentiphaga aceris]
MKASFRQCMAWLHTWTGLVTGWVLFFVFVTGTAGYVDDEITRWMQPELPLPTRVDPGDEARLLGLGLARLEIAAPQAKSWTITLPHLGLEPRVEHGLGVSWEDMPPAGRDTGRRRSETLNTATGEVEPAVLARDTAGGRRLYRLHYELHYVSRVTGFRLVGICTMLMLLAVVTGVITHKKIFTDFFTFRPGKGQRSWLDAHNVVSVMSLPFFLMITYTGLVFLAFQYLPAGRDVVYGTSEVQRQALFEELRPPKREYQPLSGLQVPVPELLRQIQVTLGDARIASLQIMQPAGKGPYIDVRPVGASGVNFYDPRVARFSAVDGRPLARADEGNAAVATQRTMFALHEGNFANWWLRWLYVVSGLLGCAVIGTGLVLWTVKRRTQHLQKAGADSFTARLNAGGLRLVEILNAGTLVGLPLAVAAYFWGNRLLPVALADRAAWELHVLFLVWGWALLYASIRPLKRAWVELLWLTVAAYALVPVLNAVTTDRHLGVTLPYGDWGLAGFDLSMLALAAIFAHTALKLQRKWRVVDGVGPAAGIVVSGRAAASSQIDVPNPVAATNPAGGRP